LISESNRREQLEAKHRRRKKQYKKWKMKTKGVEALLHLSNAEREVLKRAVQAQHEQNKQLHAQVQQLSRIRYQNGIRLH